VAKTLHRSDTEIETAVVVEVRWTPDVNSPRIDVSVNDGATSSPSCQRRHIMIGQPAHDETVMVTVSPKSASLNAVWWTTDYARHRGLPLRLVPTSPGISSIVDQVRVRFPDVVMRNANTTTPLVDALADESQHAHLIVVGHQRRNNALVTALSARARCPVVALPRGVEWSEPARPVSSVRCSDQ
jgi:hypothetical protein